MWTILRFSAILCLIVAGGSVVFGLLGEPALRPLALPLFGVGIVLLALSVILDRLARLEFLLTSANATGPHRIKTDVGDFELLGHVDGQAICLGCRKTAPKAGLYYNQAMDVYYHPRCLARDRSK